MSRVAHALTDREFDVLVIGAGVNGACIARDAALRGLSVALIDRSDFGGATSHNSLKVLHGGIRYLQHADIRRLRDSVRERRVWLRAAPHLTRTLDFIMPTFGFGTRGRATMACAFAVYNQLSRDRNVGVPESHWIPRARTVGRQECLARAPEIDSTRVSGGVTWADGQLLDADRAIVECIEDACAAGAIAVNYCEVTGIGDLDGGFRSVQLFDSAEGAKLELRSKLVVNAAGPWIADVVSNSPASAAAAGFRGSMSEMNVVVAGNGLDYAIGASGAPASDSRIGGGGRLFFATPWRGKTVLGTAHWPLQGDSDGLRVGEADVEQFLREYRSAFPMSDVSRADVEYVYAGRTPATRAGQAAPLRRLRRTTLRDHGSDGAPGVLSVRGVKWTTARSVAERAVDWAVERLSGQRLASCETEARMLPSAVGYPGDEELRSELGVDSDAWEKVRCFGVHARAIWTDSEAASDDEDSLLASVVAHVCRREWIVHLDDLVMRRLHAYFAGAPSAKDVATCASLAGRALGWDEPRIADECARVTATLERRSVSS